MQPTRPVRVVLADMPGVGRSALTALLGELPDVDLVADVEDAEQVVPTVLAERPDVVVVDDRMLRDQRWTAAELGARLIVVGVDDDPGFLARAQRLGAEAWIPKDRADAVLPVRLAAPALVSPRV